MRAIEECIEFSLSMALANHPKTSSRFVEPSVCPNEEVFQVFQSVDSETQPDWITWRRVILVLKQISLEEPAVYNQGGYRVD
jgi:hypothetical protein